MMISIGDQHIGLRLRIGDLELGVLLVPDYQSCPLDQLKCCTKMETLLIRDVINEMQVPSPPSIPDHSILRGTFITSYFKFGQQHNCSFEPFNSSSNQFCRHPPKKNLKKIDAKFFMSEEIYSAVRDTISRIEAGIDNQSQVNMLWSNIKSLFLGEIEQLPNLPTSKNKNMKKNFQEVSALLESRTSQSLVFILSAGLQAICYEHHYT